VKNQTASNQSIVASTLFQSHKSQNILEYDTNDREEYMQSILINLFVENPYSTPKFWEKYLIFFAVI